MSTADLNESEGVPTRDALLEFGFAAGEPDVDFGQTYLTYDFGNFQLSANWTITMQYVKVVSFSGNLFTPRTASEVHFAMPREVASREQCAAWIVWHLDKHDPERGFIPSRGGEWLNEGRQHLNQLPWYIDVKAYEEAYAASPRCTVERKWFRVALKQLKKNLTTQDDSAEVTFSFFDGVFTIRCGDSVVAFPANGESWSHRYSIPAGQLRSLPKRLMDELIEISIWNEKLNIARHGYEGVAKVEEPSG
jgi:hypothetical protein